VETVRAWRVEERGERNATRAARAILVARIRAAEFAADRHEGGGGRGGHALPGTRPLRLERRVLDVYAECAAQEAGRHPRLVRQGTGTPSRGRELREEGGRRDIRWGLLMEERDEVDVNGSDASRAKWTWLETLGNATSHSTVQFMVATDGSESGRSALATALSATGAAVTGYLPVAAFSVVGSPAAAAAAEAVSGVIWVGPLTPLDRTARAWDVILSLLAEVYITGAGVGIGSDVGNRTGGTARDLAAAASAATALLSADDIVIDKEGRAVVEVVLPPLISMGDRGRDRGEDVAADERVLASLATAAAREFAAGVAAAASDDGAWAHPQPASNTVLVGVRPESLTAAVAWLGAHRAAHWVAPHLRRVSRNRFSGEVISTPNRSPLTPHP